MRKLLSLPTTNMINTQKISLKDNKNDKDLKNS